jgi:hypothetical protein
MQKLDKKDHAMILPLLNNVPKTPTFVFSAIQNILKSDICVDNTSIPKMAINELNI